MGGKTVSQSPILRKTANNQVAGSVFALMTCILKFFMSSLRSRENSVNK